MVQGVVDQVGERALQRQWAASEQQRCCAEPSEGLLQALITLGQVIQKPAQGQRCSRFLHGVIAYEIQGLAHHGAQFAEAFEHVIAALAGFQ